MCLAPRYIRAPIARPSNPCKYTASLPETPCAFAMAAAARTNRTASVDFASAVRIQCMSGVLLGRRFANVPSLPHVPLVTVIARRVDGLARDEHGFRALRLDRFQRLFAGVDHRLRHLDPIAVVDG